MADLQETMGAVIRRERQERGMTLKELAERAVLSVVYLGEIERGKKYPSALVLERLAHALDMEVPDLLHLVADELAVTQQPVIARSIGFTTPQRALTPRASVGQILDMLVA
jgi:transcriptional regulator with XRE-family HTH domain